MQCLFVCREVCKMNVADTLMIAGMVAGGLACFGLGMAMLAARRGDSWHDGYKAGKLAGENQATSAQPPAPVIVLTQPQAQPVEPPTVDAAWRTVQPVRRFEVVAEVETHRRLAGGGR